MKIIEQHIIGKVSDETCEDGVVETEGYVAVIDGATSKSPMRYDGQKGGKVAMQLAKDCIKRMPSHYSVAEAVEMLTRNVREYYQKLGVWEKVRDDASARLTCSLVLYSKARNEVWMIGDCQFRYACRTYTNEKRGDILLANIRADILKYFLQQGHTLEDLRRNDMGRAFILDALRDQCNFQNAPISNPYSFVVLDGFPIDMDRVPVYKLAEVTAHERLILASDGYPVLCDTFEETERELQNVLRKDPLCMELNVATKGMVAGQKSFDDRTYVVLA